MEICYKAIKKGYIGEIGKDVKPYEKIVGFGRGNSIEEIRKKYNPSIILEEITEQELNDLWAEVNKRSEKSEWD